MSSIDAERMSAPPPIISNGVNAVSLGRGSRKNPPLPIRK